MVAAVLQDLHDTLDDLQSGLVRMPGDDDITDPRRFSPIGSNIDQHLIARMQQGRHRGSGNANASPEPQYPKQQFH
jgi:hypothetical protein